MTDITELQMPSASECIEKFALDGEADILNEAHFGIVNGHVTTNVLRTNVLSFRTLFAPPFASSDLVVEGRVFGELVKTCRYNWLPHEARREGTVRGIAVTSSTTLIEGQRALVLEIRLQNTTNRAARVPLRFEITGGMDYVTTWEFLRPKADKPCGAVCHGNMLVRANDTGEIVLGCDAGKMLWEPFASHWSTHVAVPAGQERTVHLAVAIGAIGDTTRIVSDLLNDSAGSIRKSRKKWEQRAEALVGSIPRFAAADKRLERFYYRSALHLILNQWQVKEFVLQPFYATGSVNGGCVCSYLWDFSEGWEIFPLADPDATREHIKAFLRIDLTRHFSFNPLSGAGWGPWYYINQEKIVFLIYHYIALTGDVKFLQERTGGKRVIEWVVYHALFGDRMAREANLIDYGGGNHHLELRREYRYDHYMPDLNLRRIPTYFAAEALCRIARHRSASFRDRAEKLKKLVRKEMWSAKDKWWHFLDIKKKKHLRFTMQMFKLIGNGAINGREEQAMVDHINEDEFLSEFGMHSIGKQDPAYDQVDIDNGGGGACCCFPPQIIERLYKAGYPEKAEDVLRRILWWGDRLPYWSDSLVANTMDYRKDTPLQNAVGAVAGAQAIIFGMFGVQAQPNGAIVINPAPPTFSPDIAIEGLRIRGKKINIRVTRGNYEVAVDGKISRTKVGSRLVIPARAIKQ